MASNIPIKTIKLQSSDKIHLVVPEKVARKSQMINRLIEYQGSKLEEVIHVGIPSATAEVLTKVMTYCEKHTEAENATDTDNKKSEEGSSATPASDGDLDNWDKQFVVVNPAMLSSLLVTADYLKIDRLHDLVCQKMAEITNSKQMASNIPIKTIKLQSSEKKILVVPEKVARQSQLINSLIEHQHFKLEEVIHLGIPSATAEVLVKVMTYCKKHAEAANATKTENKKAEEGSSSTPASDGELDNWDEQFVDVEPAMLCSLLVTADYLKLDGLHNLVCQKMAEITK